MLFRLIQLHLWRSSPHDGDKLGVYKSTCEHNKGDGRICDSYEDNEKRNLNDGPLSRFCGSSVIVPSLERYAGVNHKTGLGKECGEISSQLGVNYERLGNNLLPPRTSMSFLQSSLKAKRVKIYDADAEILDALRNMGIRVSIMLPNQLVINVSTNQTFLDEWVQSNVVPFHPETLIRYLNSLVPQV
ncbi:putative glucan endo-1,3-beta-glucosidase A6 [Glycine soja]|uniref:glucan endo-1,3-beta-D-glucosidase n=1 Tax=Glycine soja TaxID=3848 RepID=A0A445L9J1_GLYSO|nr:putative glucan endo-1,3-beta-glucosidase A6 [Glycine soja]